MKPLNHVCGLRYISRRTWVFFWRWGKGGSGRMYLTVCSRWWSLLMGGGEFLFDLFSGKGVVQSPLGSGWGCHGVLGAEELVWCVGIWLGGVSRSREREVGGEEATTTDIKIGWWKRIQYLTSLPPPSKKKRRKEKSHKTKHKTLTTQNLAYRFS